MEENYVRTSKEEVIKQIKKKGFDYEKYYKEKIIDLNKYLNEDDKNILKKLEITVENKIYTAYEFDVIDEKLILYYRNEEEMDEEELKSCKKLEGTGVSREEFEKVLEKFNKISKEYNL